MVFLFIITLGLGTGFVVGLLTGSVPTITAFLVAWVGCVTGYAACYENHARAIKTYSGAEKPSNDGGQEG